MISSTALSTIVTLAWLAADIHAQAPATTLPRYPEIRMQFKQSLSQALTNEHRLELYRQTVIQGRYSGRPLLTRMFGNFQAGSFSLSSITPGLPSTVLLLASDNRNVVHGNARTLRYAASVERHGSFKVVGLNRPRRNSIGATDADIVFRHRSTGLQVRMEVKNVRPASQRANMRRIQSQILKMAQDARLTGEVQVWANRQSVLPQVRTFADRHGVRIEDRLRTGNTNARPGDRSFQDFANGLDKELRLRARLTAAGGSVKAGMGLYMAYQALRQLENDRAGFSSTQRDWLRVGEHGSTLLAGVGFGAAGVAQLATQAVPLADNVRLVSFTKWGTRLGFAGTVLTEGFLVGQYLNGHMTDRQFWRGQASLAGGLAGGAAGGYVGFKTGALTGGTIGSLLGPKGTAIGAVIGGTIGAIGGGYTGAHFAGNGVEIHFQLQDAEQQESYAQFLLRHYQTR